MEIGLDTAQVKQYVTDLGAKYNTSTNDTKFKSTKRGEVTVPAGTYSWTITTDAETEALEKAILVGKISLADHLSKEVRRLTIS